MQRKSLLVGALAGLIAAGACWTVLYLRSHPEAMPAGQLTAKLRPATAMGWTAHIATRAGDGLKGDTLAEPYGVALGRDGALYVSDGEHSRILLLKADAAPQALPVSGLDTPSGLALDKAGNLYVADTGNHLIRKIAPSGEMSTLAGDGEPGEIDGPAAQARFNGPVGVAVDGDGTVYVADTYNDRIRKIAPDGTVSTLAGGKPGMLDGPGAAAQFDMPVGLALDREGNLLVADARNGAVRRVGRDGTVGTLASEGLLRRPLSLAVAHDGVVYVGDGNGRIVQIARDGVTAALADAHFKPHTAGVTENHLRLLRPAGIALAKDGSLYVAESARHVVRHLTANAPATPPQALREPAAGGAIKWPVKPGLDFHELVGTMGEVRGDYTGEARHHFHGGLDIQAEMGATVHAVADSKVLDPLAAWAPGSLGEGIAVGQFNYIHMRVGRDGADKPLDARRFAIHLDDKGKPERVRVRRGTRFAAGDVLGSVNRMYHVHLEYAPAGTKVNPLTLQLSGYRDTVAPVILGVSLHDGAGQPLGGKGKDKLSIARTAGPVAIVADAYDQMDGNAARRRLGIYRIGYQLLQGDGTPVAGYAELAYNIEFDKLPWDDAAVKVAYAEQSGITVHGNATTRFLYTLTNTVRAGSAQSGGLDLSALPAGSYTLRVLAHDHAGNSAERKVALSLE